MGTRPHFALVVLCLAVGASGVANPAVPNGTAGVYSTYRAPLATMEDGLPMLFGVAKAANERMRDSLGTLDIGKPDDACIAELSEVWRGIAERELWALKMLDASGTPGSGFLWGNNYWLGSLSMCRFLEPRTPEVIPRNSSVADGPPGEVEVFVATFRHRGSPQEHIRVANEDLLSVALCAPNVCPESTLGSLLEESLSNRALPLQRLLGLHLRMEGVRSLRWHPSSLISKPKFAIMAFITCLVLGLLIAGTIYDVSIWGPALKKAKNAAKNIAKCKAIPVGTPESKGMNLNGKTPDVELLVLDTNQNGFPSTQLNAAVPNKGMMMVEMSKLTSPNRYEEKEPRQSALGQLLVCFSLPRNTKIIMDPTVGGDSVGAIHGLRFMGMGWIILVHTVFYLSDYCDNKALAFRKAEGFMVQVVSNATLSVDTFFFISGFLLAYLYYKEKVDKEQSKEKKKEVTFKAKVIEFFLMVLRRFMRLTPTYMVVMGIADINMSWYNKTSFFTTTERADVVCSKYWWRNILYINNFFSREEMCMSWSWYLSNDMQFFILGTFLLLLSSSYFVLSTIILVIILVSSWILTGYISFSYGYIPTLDEQLAMLNILYDPPWTRVGPYLIGMCTGYLIVRLRGKLNISKNMVILLWTLGSLCNISVLFGLYERHISVLTSAFYVALSRTAWGLGLAWIIVACCTGHAGFIDSILSFGGWVPLSRLTYGAYLLNPLLMSSVYLSAERAWHIDFLPLAAVFLGHTCITYFCSYFLSLTLETPCILMMRWVMRSTNQRKPVRGRTT